MSNIVRWFLTSVGFVPLLCLGCESQVEQIHARYGESAAEKLAAVDRAVKMTADLPSPGNAYQLWIAAKEKRKELEYVRQSDKLDESVQSNAEDWIVETDKFIDQQYQEIALQIDASVVFRDGPGQNAATLLVAGDATEADSDRNGLQADWYVGRFAASDPDVLTDTYQRVANLQYLLVLREADIVRPEQVESDTEHDEYKMGAIECDAFLVDLSRQEVIHSYRYLAPNQRSVLSFGEYDMFLPSDPDNAIGVLTTRLYSAAHDFGAAVLAEMSPNVEAQHAIVRDLLGVRLVAADDVADGVTDGAAEK